MDISAVKAPSESNNQVSVSVEIPLDLTSKDTRNLPLPEEDIQTGVDIIQPSQPGVHCEGMENILNDTDNTTDIASHHGSKAMPDSGVDEVLLSDWQCCEEVEQNVFEETPPDILPM